MKQQRHVIYIPGIGDNIYHVQSAAIRFWRLYGVHGHCYEMPWAGSEEYDPKMGRLLDKIDSLKSQGHTVSLIGASAGASAVLNAFVERKDKISGLIYICAKINGPDSVSRQTYDRNPAFKTSMDKLQVNLSKINTTDKKYMLSVYSSSDKVVPYRATVISGVKEKRLSFLSHAATIIYSITFLAPTLLHFLKLASVDIE
jgi:pimeloyl-ACP methyl ester carboxylesterase